MNLQDYFRTIPHRPSFSHLRAIYEGITNERASGMTVFNRVDFDTFKRDAGTNAYAFSIKERLILLRNMVEQQMKTLVGLGLGTERLLLK